MICPKCNKNTLFIYHHNEYCQVAGAMSPSSPPAEETYCNIEGCMEIHCENCGYDEDVD